MLYVDNKLKPNETLDFNGVKIPLQRTVVHGFTCTGKSTLLQLFKHQLLQNNFDVVYLDGLERVNGLIVADVNDIKDRITSEFKSCNFRNYKELKVIIIDHLDYLLLNDFDVKVIDMLLSDEAAEYGIVGIVSSQTVSPFNLLGKIGINLKGNQIKMLYNHHDGNYTAEIKTLVKLGWTRNVINRPALNN